MKKTVLILTIALVLSGAYLLVSTERSVSAAGSEAKKADTILRHVVLFRFKEGTAPEKIQEIEKAFAALPGKIDTIIDFEWGTDVGVENLSDGFTHCFLVTFKDEEGRAAYLPHPEHKAFVDLLLPSLDKATVVDYKTPK